MLPKAVTLSSGQILILGIELCAPFEQLGPGCLKSSPPPPPPLRNPSIIQSLVFSCLHQLSFWPLTLTSDIIENYLFIIWRHLDFYFIHCIPSDEERRMRGGPSLTDNRMRRLQGVLGIFLVFICCGFVLVLSEIHYSS